MDMTTTEFARLFHDATEKYLKARAEYLGIPDNLKGTPVEDAAAMAYLTVVRDYLRFEHQVHVVTQGVRADQAQEDFLNARLAALCGQLDMLVKFQEEKPRPQADAAPEVFTATTKPEPEPKSGESVVIRAGLRWSVTEKGLVRVWRGGHYRAEILYDQHNGYLGALYLSTGCIYKTPYCDTQDETAQALVETMAAIADGFVELGKD